MHCKRKLIVVIDEAQHVAPSYQAVLKRIERLNPNRILLGLTATPVRMSDRETIILNELFNASQLSDRPDSPEVIRRFKYTDELDILINVQMVTEGVDVPSIQTVFLTRETNSDSLIMQMIGRGLRGEKAGGTKEANIVSFHDQWHKIQFWMKPEFVMGEHINGDILDSNDPEIDEDEEEKTNNIMDIGINLEELFEKLYLSMRVNILSEVITDLIPDGWFSLLQDDGRDVNVTVYLRLFQTIMT